MTRQKFFTTRQVADQLGLCHSRIRQICLQYNIGTVIQHLRLLTPEDIRRIKRTPRAADPPQKKTSKKTKKTSKSS